MRFTLAIVAAVGLAVAGLAVLFHERAAAQQAAAAQQDRAVAVELATERAQASLPAVETTAAPAAVEAAPVAAQAQPGAILAPSIRPAEALPQAGIVVQTQPQANYYFSPPTTSSTVSPHYGGFQKDFVAVAADPEMQELTAQDQQLEAEVQSLARQLADSGEENQADLKQKLAAALEKQFEAQQKLREVEISRIESRVQKLRELVRKRTDSRRKIIDNRYEQLLNDAEGLGWNTTPRSGAPYAPFMQPMPGRNPGSRPVNVLPPAAPAPTRQ